MNHKKTCKKKILNFIKNNPLENIDVVESIEKLLIEKRKYIVKMPKKRSEVALLLSGGIDSIVSWAILLKDYQLKVHPIFIKTGQKRNTYELMSVNFFSDFFKRKYPDLYVEPFKITFPTSTPEISKMMRKNLSKNIHPEVLKKNFDPVTNTIIINRKYLFPAFFPYPATLAVLFFELHKNIKIRTIFCSILPTDGLYNSSQTFTSIMSTTLSLCSYTNDFTWQLISICFDKNLGFFLNKEDLILWAYQNSIPIENTYSCFKGKKFNCGECIACNVRKEAFKKAGVYDKTIYLIDRNKEKLNLNILFKIKYLLKPIKILYKIIYKFLIARYYHKIKIIIKDYY
jgi:7-cyano-7-deazaguanine synthase in queuosine biosynthesis